MTARKHLWKGCLWGLAVFGIGCLFDFLDHELTGGFRLKAIEYIQARPPVASTLASHPFEELDSLLKQPFTFIGHGHQSYAFVSEDQQYVIKFFKFQPHRWPWLHALNPLNFFKPDLHPQTWMKKLERVFVGYQLAYDVDQANSGVRFVHLHPTTDWHSSVTVKDWFGWSYQIDLTSIFFVIQEKARTTRDVLHEDLRQGNLTAAKHRIDSLFEMYLDEYGKGLFDSDHNLMDNTGFVGDRAIRLDVGKLTRLEQANDPVFMKKDLEKIGIKRLGKWFLSYYPQYASELIEYIQAKLTMLELIQMDGS